MSASSDTIKGILVGCGFMGSMHAQIYNLLSGVQLVAVVDKRRESTQEKMKLLNCNIPIYHTLTEALQTTECDFVDICLPTHLHAAAAIEAIQAGKALFCEKPLARSLEEADQIIDAARTMGTFAQVGQCIRFWPEYQELVNYHYNQKAGTLRSLQLTRRAGRPNYSVDNWLHNPALSGGAALDLHIHDADFAFSLFGSPQSTTSHVIRNNNDPVHIFSLLAYDNFTVSMEGGWNYPGEWGFQMAFQAVYEHAVLDYDSSNEKGLTLCEAGSPPVAMDVRQPAGQSSTGEGNISSLGGYYNELEYFTNCLKNNKKPAIATLEQARESLGFVLREINNASN